MNIKQKALKTEVSSAKCWSCWADSNRRPHPYQLIGRVGFAAFGRFCALSGSEYHPFRHSCVRCFRPLISPCGSRCGSAGKNLKGTTQNLRGCKQGACVSPAPCRQMALIAVHLEDLFPALPSSPEIPAISRLPAADLC